MAATPIYPRDLVLYDKIPGWVNPNLGEPSGGIDSTTHNRVTTATYPVGTKIALYNDGSQWPGWSTFVYGKWHDGTEAGATLIEEFSNGYGFASRSCSTCTGDGSVPGPFMFTSDVTNSDMTRGGSIVVPVVDMSTSDDTGGSDTYGWFWCGGVCPIDCVTKWNSGTAGGIKTIHGAIAAGREVFLEDDGTSGVGVAQLDITATMDATDTETWEPGCAIGYVVNAGTTS